MKVSLKSCIALLLVTIPLWVQAAGQPVTVVAAENFYGDVVQQLGGAHVKVTSILNNPNDDPHLFEASISTAKALSTARLVIYNGVGYDPWMARLLSASTAPGRRTIIVGDLLRKQNGDNPHLWYHPATMSTLAVAVSAELVAASPADKAEFDLRLKQFLASLAPLDGKVKAIRAKYAGTAVTATEPVFGYMAQALGFDMRNQRLQLSVMNNTEPGASDIAAFESDLKHHKVKVLFYNSQASDQSAKRFQRLALDNKVPVVGVTESEPLGKRYQAWMLDQLIQVEQALDQGKP